MGDQVDSSVEPWTTHIHLFVRTVLSLDADEPRQTVRFCLNVNDTVEKLADNVLDLFAAKNKDAKDKNKKQNAMPAGLLGPPPGFGYGVNPVPFGNPRDYGFGDPFQRAPPKDPPLSKDPFSKYAAMIGKDSSGSDDDNRAKRWEPPSRAVPRRDPGPPKDSRDRDRNRDRDSGRDNGMDS